MISLLGIIVIVIALLQFIPLAFDLHLSGTPVEQGIESISVKIVAGFCLGFLLLIPIDILFDLANRNYHLLTSRVFLFMVSSVYSIIMLLPNSPMRLQVYACYLHFASVSIFGRLFMDLHIYDTTKTWTFSRAIGLTLLIGSVFSIALTNTIVNVQGVSYLATGLYCLFLFSFVVLCGLSAKELRYSQSTEIINPISLTITEKWKRLTHDECFLLLLMSTGSIFSVLLLLVPRIASKRYSGIHDRDSDIIVLDQIIRAAFATAVALSPSLALKFKATTLQNDLDLKQIFVRYVSHEIRTPLNIVSIGLELLKKRNRIGDLTPEELDELLDYCVVSTDAGVNILTDLLSYEKISSKAFTLELIETRLVTLVLAKLDPFRLHANQKGIQLNILTDLSSDEKITYVFVQVDPYKIAQVLRNLMSNALKFTPTGGNIDVSVTFVKKTTSKGGVVIKSQRVYNEEAEYSCVRISVADSGLGISAEDQKSLFGEFTQFNAGKNQGGGGSGLGLWITKQICSLHGGRVGVESKGEGHGSVFYIELPISKIDSTPTECVNSPLNATNFTPFIYHVCVVDDSSMNRKMIGKLLVSLGHTFEEADDGDSCLDLVKASLHGGVSRFDAILIDNQMPRMKGTIATENLRASGYRGMIIGVTGDASQEDLAHFRFCGADEVFVKPLQGVQIQDAFQTHRACA